MVVNNNRNISQQNIQPLASSNNNSNEAEVSTKISAAKQNIVTAEKKERSRAEHPKDTDKLAQKTNNLEKTSFLDSLWSGLKKIFKNIFNIKTESKASAGGTSLLDQERNDFVDKLRMKNGNNDERNYLNKLQEEGSDLLPESHGMGINFAQWEFENLKGDDEFMNKFLDGFRDFKNNQVSAENAKDGSVSEIVEKDEIIHAEPLIFDAESEMELGEKWEPNGVVDVESEFEPGEKWESEEVSNKEISEQPVLEKLEKQKETFTALNNSYELLRPKEKEIFKTQFEAIKNNVVDNQENFVGADIMADINVRNAGNLNERMKIASKLTDIRERIDTTKNLKVKSEEKEESELILYEFEKRYDSLLADVKKQGTNPETLNKNVNELDYNLASFEQRISALPREPNTERPKRNVGQ